MNTQPGLVFLLDSPNIWRGQALAGTPARVLALAEHSGKAGAAVTLVLCDRGAEYGEPSDWPYNVLLVHPTIFYSPSKLAAVLSSAHTDLLILCEAESLTAMGTELAVSVGAQLVYDVHDDEGAVAYSLGEPADVVQRYAATQQAGLAAADYVIVSTRHEAALAKTAGIEQERLALLPNGASIEQNVNWGPKLDGATLVFVGNLFYEPNARAVTSLRDTILPMLAGAGATATLRVIGRGPAELTQSDPDVDFVGQVASINDALRGATIALAPLTAGSGAKMKVLDYMAAGLPVLGTSEAVTGLPVGHPGVVVNDDLRTWSAELIALMGNPLKLKRLGRQGRRCIESELSWAKIGQDMVRQSATWLGRAHTKRSTRSEKFGTSVPRWMTEHTTQNALGEPTLEPGSHQWLALHNNHMRE